MLKFQNYKIIFTLNFFVFGIFCTLVSSSKIISINGYENCIELSNKNITVVLEPNFGGRVLIYALNNKNILYVNPKENGMTYNSGKNIPSIGPSAGRFDIGPEKISPRRPDLFMGKYEGEINGLYSARLISKEDTSTGVQLIRDFSLSQNSSFLKCTQTIKNISNEQQRYGHWSRTFAEGGGICLVPLNPRSRYPLGYIIYGPGDVLDFRPKEEPNLRTRNGILEIIGPPSRPKFAMDIAEGWLAYISKNNLLFIKKFSVFPDKIYGEMAANNVSIWYKENQVCEIEPIGPWEKIAPGDSISFTENWWLFNFPYPGNKKVDLNEIKKFLKLCD